MFFFLFSAEYEQTNIKAGFADYENYTCLKFVEAVGNEPKIINIIRDGGCWSYVGNIGSTQPLSLATGCAYVCKIAICYMYISYEAVLTYVLLINLC